jgi:TPP-dependent pyruvate/acetoin dehydrogenase alpha subunit
LATRELRAAPAAPETTSEHLTRSDRVELLRYMLMMRTSEERALTLYRQGKVPGSFYDGRGQEAISVGSSFVLGPRDRICILHRDLGAHFVRGVSPDRYLANYMGRAGGVTGGKDGNMHFGDRRLGCVGMVSMLPDMAQVATGMALAFKIRGEPRVAMTYFGEGATANGQCHEALNFAGVRRLPVVFILENNRFAYSTPTELEFAVDPVIRAEGYGFPGMSVDGNDVEAVFEASRVAAERARRGGGPTLIECHTMRMHGHGAHDDMSYVPKELLEEWERRDPITSYERRLVDEHGFSRDELDAVRKTVGRQVEECAALALESPMPDPELALEGVFAERWEPLGDGQAPWSRWSRAEAAAPEDRFGPAPTSGKPSSSGNGAAAPGAGRGPAPTPGKRSSPGPAHGGDDAAAVGEQ